MKTDEKGDISRVSQQASYQIRLPSFITGDEIGLGDLIKRVTSAAGIKPCGGCEKRAAALNRWLALTGSSNKY